MIDTFSNLIKTFHKHSNELKINLANELNQLLDELKEKEKEIFNYQNDTLSDDIKYDNYYFPTDGYLQRKAQKEIKYHEELYTEIEKEEEQKRNELVKNFLSITEMKMIEKEIGRYFDSKLFDSTKQNWEIEWSEFYNSIIQAHHFIILFETSEFQYFGCYITSEIDGCGKFITDENAFLFKVNDDTFQKFPIVEKVNAFQVFDDKNENLFILGFAWSAFDWYGDVLIKKKQLRCNCYCYQKSFNYYKQQNILIGKTGLFTIRKFIVVSTIDQDKYFERQKTIVSKRIEIETQNKQKERENHINNERKMLAKVQKKQKRIERYETLDVKNYIELEEFLQFEDWTSKKIRKVLFDSTVDNWGKKTSIFNDKIIGKKQLIFLIEDEDGEKFGYYFNPIIPKNHGSSVAADNECFLFNLKSVNQRLSQPMKFEIKNIDFGSLTLFTTFESNLITLSTIGLYKEEMKNDCCCIQNNNFDYHGIDNALCGKTLQNDKSKYFIPKRILVIQMK